jgi:hypothetical protein
MDETSTPAEPLDELPAEPAAEATVESAAEAVAEQAVELPLAPPEPPSPPSPPPAPPKFDLWMLAALGSVPLTVIIFCMPDFPWLGRVVMLLFVAGVGIHCRIQHNKGQPLAWASLTGAWLLPAIMIFGLLRESRRFGAPRFEDIFCFFAGFALVGIVSGFLTAKLIEAVLVFKAAMLRRMRGGGERSVETKSIRERLDEESLPVEAPPTFGLPRRFGIRGMLVTTTWAALLMGGLRACGANGTVFFMVTMFIAGVLAAQVLLFQGRSPIKASAWTGAFLLPALTLVLFLYWEWHSILDQPTGAVLGGAAFCAVLMPAGIVLGAVTGAVGGFLYYFGDDFFVTLFRGVPNVVLEPIDDADADVLINWISGPKLCRRWAGDQLTYPLDRTQLLDRFAAARGEQPTRRILKAVDARGGNMVGYVELGHIDYKAHRAWLEHPLVDPEASERGRIGVLLLRAVAREAFRKLGAIELLVSAETERPEIAAACDKAWLINYYFRRLPNKSGAGWSAVYRATAPEQIRELSRDDDRGDPSE